mgnify:CR=1 FL=1
MKRLFTLSFVLLLLASCGGGAEQKAAEKLQLAQQALDAGDFNRAKTEIDSIKILYPKAFDARKRGIILMQQVELKEQEQTVAYLDSLLTAKEAAFAEIKNRFVLEKDTAYQEVGNYFWPTQVVEKNLHRSFLRFQVSERGVLSMTSIYCGPINIHHFAVKVSAPDGTFAETPASNDSYETTDMDEKIEKADYRLGEDGSVMGFINLNHDKNIRVEYLGGKKYVTTMLPTDRQALKELYVLSQLLTTIDQAKKEREEAMLKMGFITRKIKENQPEE